MTTTPDDATTWRDLADQLTDKERACLEHLEQHSQGQMSAEVLLDYARRDIEGRLADMAYCDVPAPAGATWVGKWEKHSELWLVAWAAVAGVPRLGNVRGCRRQPAVRRHRCTPHLALRG